MTDPIAPEPTPPPAAPAAPAYAPAPAAGPKQALSLTSFILGIAGLVFSWVPFLGFLASLAAIILGFIGRKKEPAAPKWMSLIGIILGFVAIVIGIIVIAFLVIGIIANAALLNGVNTN
ncbi:MAG: hypothetical protein JWR36_1742 [Glaciihabitans sp.]|jgi:hypothetical protein|nr:hypothetical protein [Glaciihabitans sp.]MDQ1569852.1 hypothetical protein [Actinomycetota bacterium]